MKRLIIISFLGVLVVCSSDMKQSPVIDEQTFINIYCDVVSHAELLAPPNKKVFVDSVLNHYQVSEHDFENTVRSYMEDPSEWKKVFDNILIELEDRLKQGDDSPAPDSLLLINPNNRKFKEKIKSNI